MNTKQLKQISKFMSLVLRHRPELLQLEMDAQGWVAVEELIQKIQQRHANFNQAILEEVVATNNKKRFAFSADGQKIRASQGHSINIELGYTPVVPPKTLFHGTATRFVTSIQAKGLMKLKRHHVHLSEEWATAVEVGKRHGKVVVFEVAAQALHEQGQAFYQSENGVWLTESVPPRYLTLLEG